MRSRRKKTPEERAACKLFRRELNKRRQQGKFVLFPKAVHIEEPMSRRNRKVIDRTSRLPEYLKEASVEYIAAMKAVGGNLSFPELPSEP